MSHRTMSHRTLIALFLWMLVGCGDENSGSAQDRDGADETVGDSAIDTGDGADDDASSDSVNEELRLDSVEETTTDTSEPPTGPQMGLLQFHVVHNLQTQDCLPADCDLSIHEDEAPVPWLAQIRDSSNMAVLHWDRPLPYLAFSEPVPEGEDGQTFYSERIPAELLRWIDAFDDHFESMDRRYLAVSLLAGSRDGYQALYLGSDNEVPITDSCPDFTPGTSFTVELPTEDGTVEETIYPGEAYIRFLEYLYERLDPDYFGIMVEVNLLKELCPGSWDSMVLLYRQVYDTMRAEVGEALPLFATVTLSDLLGYDQESCYELLFSTCDEPLDTDYGPLDVDVCYPIDRTALDDLSAGNRLDLLALSIYPDGLMMAPPGVEAPVIELYENDWNGETACWMHAPYGPYLDPFAQLDRLGWDGPVALAEWSARSCPTYARIEEGAGFWAQAGGSPTSQQFWMQNALDREADDQFEFVVWSFLQDYDPIPKWLVDDEVFDVWLYNVFNTWPCSGLLTVDGEPKSLVLDTWLDHMERNE